MPKPNLPAGWGFPATSRKCHYFPEGELTSLCGRWGFFSGRRQPDEGSSPDDCKACRTVLTSRKQIADA